MPSPEMDLSSIMPGIVSSPSSLDQLTSVRDTKGVLSCLRLSAKWTTGKTLKLYAKSLEMLVETQKRTSAYADSARRRYGSSFRTPRASLSSLKPTNRECRRWLVDVQSVKSTWTTIAGLSHL